MIFSRGFILFLALFLSLPSFAKKQSFLKKLKTITTFNHSKAACHFDDDDKKAPLESKVKCDSPVILAASCNRQHENRNGEWLENTNIMKMNCNVCGTPMDIYGKLGKEESTDENAPNNYEYDTAKHLHTYLSLKEIIQLCRHSYTAEQIEWISGDSYSSLEDVFEWMGYSFNSPPKQEGEDSPSVIGFASTGKLCEDEDKEIKEFMPPLVNPDISVGEKLIMHFSKILNNRNSKKLLVDGFPGLFGVLAYQAHGKIEYIEEINKSMPYSSMKLDTTELKNRVHHLIFNDTVPDHLLENLNSNVNKKLFERLIDPACPSDFIEHLNISTKDSNENLKTKKYLLKCVIDNEQKVLTLKDL